MSILHRILPIAEPVVIGLIPMNAIAPIVVPQLENNTYVKNNEHLEEKGEDRIRLEFLKR